MELEACLSGAADAPRSGEGEEGGGARALPFALERDRVECPEGAARVAGAVGQLVLE